MKRTLRSYAYLALLLVLLGSCGKKTNVPVPEDAGMVIHINGASLHSKLSWDEFKQGELYKMAKEEIRDELAQKILDNPDSSGVDIKSDAYFFLRSGATSSYAAFTCNLKDENAFARMIEKMGIGREIMKEGDLSVITMGNDAVLTWNSKRLVIIGDASDLNRGAYGGGSRGNLTTDSLKRFAREVYDIKGSNSIASNNKFSSMINDGGDAHFWINSGSMYSGGAMKEALTMLPKLTTFIQGNYTASTFNFDNGKITATAKSYYNKELAELYKKFTMKNLDEAALKKIPAGDIDAVFAMSYPPEGLKEVLSLIGVDGLANAYLSQLNYSIDEFVKGNKGDIIIAVSDFKFAPHEVSYPMGSGAMTTTVTKPEVKVLFANSVKEKASWDKLMTILHEKVASEGGAAAQAIIDKVPYKLSNDWFVAGNDSSYVHTFGGTSTNHAFIDRIKGHPMGAFIDIQKFINGSRSSFSSDSTATLVADESLKMWQDIVFYGGEKDGDAIISYGELNLVDKNTNSLKQLNNYFGKIAAIMNEREKRRKAEWENMRFNDSTSAQTIPPPPPPMEELKEVK
jgi:hypothetical protein